MFVQLKKVVVICLGVLCVYFTAKGTHASSDIDQLKAATLYYPPYEYDLNGRPSGLAIDILNEATERMGMKRPDVTFYPWKRAVSHTQMGTSHVLFNAGKNKGRQEWGKYSNHILILQKYYLFTRKGEKLTTNMRFDGLKDQAIAVRRGYLYGDGAFKKAITDNKSFANVALSDNTENSLRLLLGERVDMFVGDYLPVMHYIINNGLEDKVELVKDIETKENLVVLSWPTYFLFSKKSVSSAFVADFDQAIQTMIKDGSYQKIYDRYNLKYKLSDN